MIYHNKFVTRLDCDIDTVYCALKDLSHYSEIIPYIKKISFHSLETKPIKAFIELEHLLIKLNYYCDIHFDDENYSVFVDGYGGSFENIDGMWKLKKISDNETEVSYDLKFKLKSRIQQAIAAKIFNLYEKKIHDKLENYIRKLSNQKKS